MRVRREVSNENTNTLEVCTGVIWTYCPCYLSERNTKNTGITNNIYQVVNYLIY